MMNLRALPWPGCVAGVMVDQDLGVSLVGWDYGFYGGGAREFEKLRAVAELLLRISKDQEREERRSIAAEAPKPKPVVRQSRRKKA